MDNEQIDLELSIDSTTLRWYRRLLVLRHGSILVGGVSAVVVASPLESVREVAGGLVLVSLLVFALSMTVFLWPLSARALAGRPTTYVRIHHSFNVLTSHSLVDELEPEDDALVTRRNLRTVVGIEIVLVVLFVVVAIVS